MMYNATRSAGDEERLCNNFARKAVPPRRPPPPPHAPGQVRAWFHDVLTGGLDGSILSELDLDMNFGLCRFGQCRCSRLQPP